MRGAGEPRDVDAIPLPPSIPLTMTLETALGLRRSHRQYTGDAMSLAYLATILRAAGATTGVSENSPCICGERSVC